MYIFISIRNANYTYQQEQHLNVIYIIILFGILIFPDDGFLYLSWNMLQKVI